ncbi:MAG: hypothetical protein GC162_18415 [Planctomycetes bacterium]|nr:hypothetical protein [Planctomycetota bacterium]
MTRTHLFLAATVVYAAFSFSPLMAQDAVTGVAGEATPLKPRDAESLPPDLKKALDLWEDYIHYLRVANLEMANTAGSGFLGLNLPSEQILTVIEEISSYTDYDETLQRTERMGGAPSDLAKKVSERINDARLDVAREGKRIRESITSLDDGLRARLNAQTRLKRAGEYAAPQLLAVILSVDHEDQILRPYVIETMVTLGRPMVAPLCEALHDLPDVPKQQVGEVLSRIGYPLALPYLKAELDRKDVSDDTKKVLKLAYDRIVDRTGVPVETSSDRLFFMLGEDYYAHRESLIMEPDADFNLMWTYDSGTGLSFLKIPTPIFADVMTMRACRRALQINRGLSPAFSLWIAANFRRENHLPAGAEDPSYSAKMQSPHFYATLAGPSHLQPVLQRALADMDPDLALDAISALSSTSGAISLLNVQGSIQPLIAAMNYPDRRVRFEAAFTIARSLPQTDFSGSQRVVPVLSEAVRESGKLYAVAIAPDTEAINSVTQLIEGAGQYRMLLGNSIDVAMAQVATAPGVDLIVVNQPMDQALATVANARRISKLAATPIVILAGSGEVISMTRMVDDKPMVYVTDREAGKDKMIEALKQAAAAAAGGTLSDDQAQTYALTALGILKDLTFANSTIFHVADAKPALLEALNDTRDPVTLAAADVLALMPQPEAQVALADAALAGKRGAAMQVQLLQDLAHSARANGNQLSDLHLRKILELVDSAKGPVADAAADAHGALNLPTSNGVELIVGN